MKGHIPGEKGKWLKAGRCNLANQASYLKFIRDATLNKRCCSVLTAALVHGGWQIWAEFNMTCLLSSLLSVLFKKIKEKK